MRVTIVTPETKDFEYNIRPCVFLAGPCTDSRNWHSEVVKYFQEIESDQEIVFFNPQNFNFKDLGEQADWETYHLNYAYNNGLVAFYLSNKVKSTLDRGYARTTRFELGEWLSKYKHMNSMLNLEHKETLLTIAMEDKFEGGEYISHRIKKDYGIKFIPNNMEDFCKEIYKKLF